MFIQPGSACKTRADRGLKRAEEDFRGCCHACARARSSAARLGPVRSILTRPGAPGALRLCAPARPVPSSCTQAPLAEMPGKDRERVWGGVKRRGREPPRPPDGHCSASTGGSATATGIFNLTLERAPRLRPIRHPAR